MASATVGILRVLLSMDTAEFESGAKKASSSAKTMGRDFQNAFDKFSGDKVIREANTYAAAIEKVGGVAKLTAIEQQNVNRVVTEAIAKYAQLGQTAPKHLTDLANATKQLEIPTQKAGALMGVLGSAFGQFTAAGLATTAISKLVGGIGDLVSQGAKLPGLQASFQRLATGAGQNAQQMLEAMEKGTRGLVTNIDLMQSANKAMLLGLPVTAKSMGDLSEAATKLGKAMGLDATQSLNDLITALGRSSPLILDNLGLTVKVGEANDAYAKKLGKTSEQLTDAEKKMAFYEAAMEAARKKTAELGDQTKTLGEVAETAWTKFSNGVTGAVGVMNSAIPKVLSNMEKFKIFAMTMAAGFGPGKALQAVEEFDAARARRSGRKDTNLPVDQTPEQQMAALATAANTLRTQALAPLTAEQNRLVIAFDKGGKSAQEIAAEFAKYKATAHITETQIERVIAAQTKQAKAGDVVAEAIKRIAASQIPLNDAQKQQVVSLDALGISHADIAKKLGISELAIKRWMGGLTAATAKIEPMKRSLNDLLQVAGIQSPIALLQRPKTALTDNIPSTALMLEDLKKQGPLVWAKAMAALGKGNTTQGPMVESLFTAMFGSGEAFGALLGGSIMSAVQGGGNVLASVGGTIGQSMMGGLAKNLTTEGGIKITGALGGMLSSVLPGLGALLGPIMSKIGDKLIDALGLGTKGRDAMRGFIAEMGGEDKLRADLTRNLGLSEANRLMEQLFRTGRNNAAQAASNIKAITDALAIGTQRTEQFNDALGGMLQHVQRLGGSLPESLRTYLRELERGGRLTQQNIDLLNQLSNDGVVDWNTIQEAVQRYGGDIEKLGGSFQSQRLHDSWQQVIDDIDLFTRGNISASDIIGLTKEKIIDLANQSRTFGTEIPENMRPWLQKLADSGELLDETTGKIIEMDSLTFGETLQTTLQTLNDTLKELVDTFRTVPGAIAAIPRRVDIDVSLNRRGDVGEESGQPALVARGGLVGRHGVRYFGAGGAARGTDTVPAMLTPGELILNAAQQSNLAEAFQAAMGAVNAMFHAPSRMMDSVGRGPMQATAILEVDKRELGRAVADVLPGELRRLGVRVRSS